MYRVKCADAAINYGVPVLKVWVVKLRRATVLGVWERKRGNIGGRFYRG